MKRFEEMSRTHTMEQLVHNNTVLIINNEFTNNLMQFYGEFPLKRTDGNGSGVLTGIPIARYVNNTVKIKYQRMYALDI